METVSVQVRFSLTKNGLTLADAIYYTPAQFAASTAQSRLVEQQERFDSWYQAVTNPPPEPVIDPADTLNDLVNQVQDLVQQTQSLALQLGVDISDQVSAIAAQQTDITGMLSDALVSQADPAPQDVLTLEK